MFEIKAKKRNLKDILPKEDIMAVYYGAGVNSTSISINLNEFKKVWEKAGESTAIKLSVEGTVVNVLIHDIQLNPITNFPTHVDFLVIDMNKTVVVSVPLEFVGVSPAVKSGLGILVKVLHEVEVEALPKDLPQVIEVDISPLVDLDSSILVSNLVFPKGVTAVAEMEEVVAAITPQKEEVETNTPIDLSAIEVEKKGKKEEDVDNAG
ncbi:MAG: 50S ribosomal protein L25 [Candidatus Paceibacterota bacterium]